MYDLLDALCAHSNGFHRAPSMVIVAAHPDDETISAGGRLIRFRNTTIVHVTDGAPRNMLDATAAGFTTRQAYVRARRGELAGALALIEIGMDQVRTLGVVDQEASLDMAGVACRLADILRELEPEIILTHPYEGGHPDHDAAALAVHAACKLVAQDRIRVPLVVEFTSYHDQNGGMSTFEFLPCSACDVRTTVLADGEREIKRKMVDCFTTQQRTLAPFPVHLERFRPAPHYDFSRPPHPGTLFYERYDWGMMGERWRALARQAMDQLDQMP